MLHSGRRAILAVDPLPQDGGASSWSRRAAHRASDPYCGGAAACPPRRRRAISALPSAQDHGVPARVNGWDGISRAPRQYVNPHGVPPGRHLRRAREPRVPARRSGFAPRVSPSSRLAPASVVHRGRPVGLSSHRHRHGRHAHVLVTDADLRAGSPAHRAGHHRSDGCAARGASAAHERAAALHGCRPGPGRPRDAPDTAVDCSSVVTYTLVSFHAHPTRRR